MSRFERTNCSTKSFEPTLTLSPLKSSSLSDSTPSSSSRAVSQTSVVAPSPGSPPGASSALSSSPPQAAASSVSAASPARALLSRRWMVMELCSLGWGRWGAAKPSGDRPTSEAARAEGSFDECGDPVDGERDEGGEPSAGHDDEVPLELDPGADRLAETTAADEVGEGGHADVDDQ